MMLPPVLNPAGGLHTALSRRRLRDVRANVDSALRAVERPVDAFKLQVQHSTLRGASFARAVVSPATLLLDGVLGSWREDEMEKLGIVGCTLRGTAEACVGLPFLLADSDNLLCVLVGLVAFVPGGLAAGGAMVGAQAAALAGAVPKLLATAMGGAAGLPAGVWKGARLATSMEAKAHVDHLLQKLSGDPDARATARLIPRQRALKFWMRFVNQQDRSTLQQYRAWTPDTARLQTYHRILAEVPFVGSSPNVEAYLRMLIILEGPARPFRVGYGDGLSRTEHRPSRTYKTMKEFVAEAIGHKRVLTIIDLAHAQELFIHGENLTHLGQFLLSSCDDFARAFMTIYRHDQRNGTGFQKLTGLLENINVCCLNNKVNNLNEYLEKNDLCGAQNLERVLDLAGKTDNASRALEYLRVFRLDRIHQFVSEHGGDAEAAQNNPLFMREYFNAQTFAAHLTAANFDADPHDKPIATIIEEFIEQIILEPAP